MPNQIRALLVEDNPADAYLEKRALRNILPVAFDVYCADRLEDALKLLREIRFDVVLLDLGLPESGGLDTLQRVRAAEDSVAIVVLTGVADEATSLQALDRGAQDFLLKSEVTPETLHRTIRFAIHRQQVQHLSAQVGSPARDDLEARLCAALEAASAAIVTIAADGSIRDWNRGAEKLLGWRANEVAGRPLEDFLDLVVDDLDREGEPVAAEILDRRQRTLAVEARITVVQTDQQCIRALSLQPAEVGPTPSNRKVPATASK